jgi:hypothetical protein
MKNINHWVVRMTAILHKQFKDIGTVLAVQVHTV